MLFALIGLAALGGGLALGVPDPAATNAAPDIEAEDEVEGGDQAQEGVANSEELPVLIAPLVADNREVVGYQSLAIAVVSASKPTREEMRRLEILVEDSFYEWIATSTPEQRRDGFDDLLSLAASLETAARSRLPKPLDFDLVALQSDVFAKTETRQNLIEPK